MVVLDTRICFESFLLDIRESKLPPYSLNDFGLIQYPLSSIHSLIEE